jgi:predicted amidohydrolase YtcJ
MRRLTRLVFMGLLLAVGGSGQAQTPQPADLIIHHAIIYTVDAKRPRAEALAIRGNRLVFVGDNAGALALKGPKTREIDAGGRAVFPGLHDAHGHFTGLGAALQQIDLRGTPTY